MGTEYIEVLLQFALRSLVFHFFFVYDLVRSVHCRYAALFVPTRIRVPLPSGLELLGLTRWELFKEP